MFKSSEFIASRIAWKARKNGFPNPDVVLNETKDNIELVVPKTNLKMTSSFITYGDKKILLEDIESVSYGESRDIPKSQRTVLSLSLSSGQKANITLPSGAVYFGFFNILIMVINLVR